MSAFFNDLRDLRDLRDFKKTSVIHRDTYRPAVMNDARFSRLARYENEEFTLRK